MLMFLEETNAKKQTVQNSLATITAFISNNVLMGKKMLTNDH